jgi:hypothetical protein
MSTTSMTSTSALQNAANQFRENTRLRIGVYAILASLWLYGLLVLHDHIKREREAWQTSENQIVRIKNAAANVDWTTRAQEVKTTLSDYERLLWREGSVGVSQAALQESLARNFAAAGMQVRVTQVAATEAAVPTITTNESNPINDLAPIRIRAQVDFRPQSFYTWLLSLNRDRLEKRPTVVIESLVVRGGQTPVADMELIGYAMRNVTNVANAPNTAATPAPPATSPAGAAK